MREITTLEDILDRKMGKGVGQPAYELDAMDISCFIDICAESHLQRSWRLG
jgi:hypothetical protein